MSILTFSYISCLKGFSF